MSIEKLELVSIAGAAPSLNEAIVACLQSKVFHIENMEQFHTLVMKCFFRFPVTRETEDTGKHAAFDLVMQSDPDILFYRQV